jgi:hypothetical protein
MLLHSNMTGKGTPHSMVHRITNRILPSLLNLLRNGNNEKQMSIINKLEKVYVTHGRIHLRNYEKR